MKNKGFTLVELLAVIAIMAIILIIAIPNVMESLNEGKRKTFGNEVTTIQNSAKTQFNLDKGRGTVKYTISNGQRFAYYCNNLSDDKNCMTAKSSVENDEDYKYKVELDID